MVQIAAGIYVPCTKRNDMVVSLVGIKLYPLYVVEVTPLQSQNFLVFVEIGIFVEFFRWERANAVEGVTGPDSFLRRIYTKFSRRGKARAVRL